jgi:vacuolar-type H+-ATPase subunit H
MENVTQTTPVPAPKARGKNSDQDKQIADAITRAAKLIGIVRTDAEMAAILSTRGYDTAKLNEGSSLQGSAQAAYGNRQRVLGAQKEATRALADAEKTARREYADFRQTARAIFGEEADRTALGLNGRVPGDLQKFITVARASYGAAAGTTYAGALATYGYPAPTLQAASDTLDYLAQTDEAQAKAIGTATGGTGDRDAAFEALQAWVRQFRTIAKVAFRSKPELGKKLEA